MDHDDRHASIKDALEDFPHDYRSTERGQIIADILVSYYAAD